MGQNSQAKRQHKKRQQQRKQKRSDRASSKVAFLQDELVELCEPLMMSLNQGEPPLLSTLEHWSSVPINHSLQPLRAMLVSFVHFVFHQQRPQGDLAQLLPYHRAMQRAELTGLYAVLYAYCLLSDHALIGGDAGDLLQAFEAIPMPDHLGSWQSGGARAAAERVCVPIYLLFWAWGKPVGSLAQQHQWLHCWLAGSPLTRWLPALKKFLQLKYPKPGQKTVQALESAVAGLGVMHQDSWQQGVGQLVRVFLQQRLPVAQQHWADWAQQCPQLSRLAGLGNGAGHGGWSQIALSQVNTATLNRISRLLDTAASMPYPERLQLGALKCRLLARFVQTHDINPNNFEHQLEQVIHLLSKDVPVQYQQLAAQGLLSLCEWLAQEVGSGRLPPPPIARIRQLIRLRPNDYRIALLVFLVRGNQAITTQTADQIEYQQVHFPLWFQVLYNEVGRSGSRRGAVLDRFFWPLTGETKKAFFLQCWHMLCLRMNEQEAKQFWQHWQSALFDTTQEPFAAILNGQACETELLLYIAMAAVACGYGIHWLSPDHLERLLWFAQQLVFSHTSGFNQQHSCALLTACAQLDAAERLFQDWSTVIALLQRVDNLAQWEQFLSVALQHSDRCDGHMRRQLFELCQALPALKNKTLLSSRDLFGERI